MKNYLNIGLYGYYNSGEFCDDYLEMAIKRTLNKIAGEYGIGLIYNDKKLSPDGVILGGGSIIGIEYNFGNVINTKVPFYIFGSGFRGINSNRIELFQNLWNRASLIALRGEVSKHKLEKLGFDTSKVDILGDPIFLCENHLKNNENSENRKSFIGGVFRPYFTRDDTIKKIYEYLSKIRCEDVKLFTFAKSQGDDIGGRRIGFNTIDNLGAIQTYREMRNASFWFGNRLHPFCIALIHGIPTIGLDIEFDKVEDVCSSIDYPYYIKNENLYLDSFRKMYVNLMDNEKEGNADNWEKINERVQIKINDIRNNLKTFARKIVDDIISKGS